MLPSCAGGVDRNPRAVDRGKDGHVPGLCDHNVVEGVVLVAKAGKSNPENHVGCMVLQLMRARD